MRTSGTGHPGSPSGNDGVRKGKKRERERGGWKKSAAARGRKMGIVRLKKGGGECEKQIKEMR